MTAADARRVVRQLGAEDAVQKAVADAPPLSDHQLVALRGILLPELNDGAGTDTDPINDQGTPRRGLRAS